MGYLMRHEVMNLFLVIFFLQDDVAEYKQPDPSGIQISCWIKKSLHQPHQESNMKQMYLKKDDIFN